MTKFKNRVTDYDWDQAFPPQPHQPHPTDAESRLPDPDSPLPLLHLFLTSNNSLAEIAQELGTNLSTIAAQLASPQLQAILQTLRDLSALREQAILTEARVEAIVTLREIARSPAPPDQPHAHQHNETARRAAAQLLRMDPVPAAPTPDKQTTDKPINPKTGNQKTDCIPRPQPAQV